MNSSVDDRQDLELILKRHETDLSGSWSRYPDEIAPLKRYIQHVSHRELLCTTISRASESTISALIVAGRRIGLLDGLRSIMEEVRFIQERGGKAAVLFSEADEPVVPHTGHRSATQLAQELRGLGHQGDIIEDLSAKNTGDQAVAAVAAIEDRDITTVIVAASLDHVGRMTATIADAMRYRDLLDSRVILPLPSGSWGDVFLEGLTLEELAFLAHTDDPNDPKNAAIDAVGGQYTFRWIRALEAKERGKYPGRAILKPSEMLRIFDSYTRRGA